MTRSVAHWDEKYQELQHRVEEVVNLGRAEGVLSWDQQTYMPPGGAQARAESAAALARIVHERITDPHTGELLNDLSTTLPELHPDSVEAAFLRVVKREYDRLVKLPARWVEENARVSSLAQVVWVKAKQESDFSSFAPYLERLFALAREAADYLGYEERPYDALLAQYEPGVRASQLERWFAELKPVLTRLVQEIASKQPGGLPATADDEPFGPAAEFPDAQQWELGQRVLRAMGFDFQRGRQDRSIHPFTTSFSPGDVRITTWIVPRNFLSALYSTVHEGGHALYEQGIPPELSRIGLGQPSLGVHESQSRLWENIVGRSREFWQYWLPQAQELFPGQLSGFTVESMYHLVNQVRPSFIRTEADEVTYNLHIFVRFELELALLERRLEVAELPEAWNRKMEQYLGICPPDAARGVLQDVHWSDGLIGYFPTYALGNILSAQFYEQALAEVPSIPAEIARGHLLPLKEWLNQRIHVHGGKYESQVLVQKVTGQPLVTQPYLQYIQAKYSELYGL
ncbi:MAG: carboxypeptidase M32 [Limnochordaceae bacterium]|nr:carboxypeptidase M32 [Limnochordaceae bacterium]